MSHWPGLGFSSYPHLAHRMQSGDVLTILANRATQLFGGGSAKDKCTEFDTWLIEQLRSRCPTLPPDFSLEGLGLLALTGPRGLWAICMEDLMHVRDEIMDAFWGPQYALAARLEEASPVLFSLLETIRTVEPPHFYPPVSSPGPDAEALRGLIGKQVAARWLKSQLEAHSMTSEIGDPENFIKRMVRGDSVARKYAGEIAHAVVTWLSAGGSAPSFSVMYSKAINERCAAALPRRITHMVMVVKEMTPGWNAVARSKVLKSLAWFRNCKGTLPVEDLKRLLTWCTDIHGRIIPAVLKHFAHLYHRSGQLPDVDSVQWTSVNPWGSAQPNPESPLRVWSRFYQGRHSSCNSEGTTRPSTSASDTPR